MSDLVNTTERLEYLRGELRAERISYGELAELRELAPYIDSGDGYEGLETLIAVVDHACVLLGRDEE